MRLPSLTSAVALALSLFGTMPAAHAGTARSVLTVTATILPSPCSPENKDPNCIPVTQTVTTTTRRYPVAVPAPEPDAPPTTRMVEGTVTVVTISY